MKYEVELASWLRRFDLVGKPEFTQAFPPGYLNLLFYFVGDDRLREFYEAKQLQNAELFKDWGYFFLNLSSSPEQIAQFRFLPQFLASVWGAPSDSLLYYFREVLEVMNNPTRSQVEGISSVYL